MLSGWLSDWESRADALATELQAAGPLTDRGWFDAVRRVPRDELVPSYHVPAADLSGWRRLAADDPDTRAAWADGVYQDRTLVTELRTETDEFGPFPVPVSSSTLPSLMVRMLDVLSPIDAGHVVEIGTGCGYNAALLCTRIQDSQVSSVDVVPALVDTARARLARLGWRPALAVTDGARWCPRRPFDRLIATCSVSKVPGSWLRAAVPGAVLVVPFTGALADGALGRLVADGAGGATGTLLPVYAGFMPLRTGPRSPIQRTGSAEPTLPRPTPIAPDLLAASHPFAFAAERLLPELGPRRIGTAPDGVQVTVLTTRDGRSARLWRSSTDEVLVSVTGRPDLWSEVERTYEWWIDRDRPGWERFGVTVTPRVQRFWLDTPDNPLS